MQYACALANCYFHYSTFRLQFFDLISTVNMSVEFLMRYGFETIPAAAQLSIGEVTLESPAMPAMQGSVRLSVPTEELRYSPE